MQLFDFKEVQYLERDTNSPTFSGTIPSEIDKGGTVIITIGDKTYTTEINKQDGKWSWTPPEDFTDGHYSLSIIVRDKAGNISPPALRTLIIDTTPPEAPQLLMMYDDQGKETGIIHPGDKTDDRRPTLTGVAQKGTIIYLKDGDKIIGSATADEKSGVWTIEPEQDLSDGPHKLTLVAKETFAGKERWGDETQAFDIIIGDDAPGVPVIGSVIDDVGTITGNISNGGVTDDKRPTLTGTADANSIVTLFVDGKAAGSVRVDSTGRWSLTPLADLADGLHKLTVTASDDKGNSSIETASWDITVDTVIDTPTITSVFDDFGSSTGEIANGGKTDDTTPTLSGKAEAGSVVTVYDGTTALGSATADTNGNWTFTPTTPLSHGDHNLNVTAVDKAGNVSGKSDNWAVTIVADYNSGSQNFDKYKSEIYEQGGVYDLNGFIIEVINTGIYKSNGYTGILGDSTKRLSIGENGLIKISVGETNSVSFETYGFNGGVSTIKYYSQDGTFLGEQKLTYNKLDNSFIAPAGRLIGYFTITNNDPIGVGYDNFKWGNDTGLVKKTSTFNIDSETYDFYLAGVFEQEEIRLDYSSKINIDDVLEKGKRDLFIEDGKEQVLVKGKEGDKIELSDLLKDGTDLGDWKQEAGTVTIAGEQYNVYQHSGSDVEVLVQMSVQVELQNH